MKNRSNFILLFLCLLFANNLCHSEKLFFDFVNNPGSKNLNNYVSSSIMENSGKIICVGNFTSYAGKPYNYIVRINPDSSPDTSFNIGTGFNGAATKIIQQKDGKYLVIGNFNSFNGKSYNRLVRLNYDGSVDTSFKIGVGFNNTVTGIGILRSGSILVGGLFDSYNNSRFYGLVCLTSTGEIDTSFNLNVGFYKFQREIILDIRITIFNDDEIYIHGYIDCFNYQTVAGVFRLKSDGSIDTNFNYKCSIMSHINSIAKDGNNLFLAGLIKDELDYRDNKNKILDKVDLNGVSDTNFQKNIKFDPYVNYPYCINIDKKSRIMLGGKFLYLSDKNIASFIILNPDGTIFKELSFEENFNSNIINSIHYNEIDNYYYVCGAFSAYQGVTAMNIAKLKANRLVCDTVIKKTCMGNIIYLPLNLRDSLPYNTIFTAQLSDVYGSFAKPIIIGNALMNKSGYLKIRIPYNLYQGDNYSIRIKSSWPPTYFENSIDSLIIYSKPKINIQGPTGITKNSLCEYYQELGEGIDYEWSVLGGEIIGAKDSNVVKVKWGAYDTGKIYLRSFYPSCGCDSYDTLNVVLKSRYNDLVSIEGDSIVRPGVLYCYSTNLDTTKSLIWRVFGGEIIGDSNKINVCVNWFNKSEGLISLIYKNDKVENIYNSKNIKIFGRENILSFKYINCDNNARLNCLIETPDKQDYKIEIRDVSGKIVLTNVLHPINVNLNEIDYDLSAWANGVYFISVFNNEHRIDNRFLISR